MVDTNAPPKGLLGGGHRTLTVQLGDGGFNCQINRSGCTHSSLHSTLSVLEGFQRYEAANHTYRISQVRKTAAQAHDFILQHRFYKSDRTGQIISPDFLRFPYPARWRYNILRALDHFRASGQPYHPAMCDALEVVQSYRRSDGLWPRMAKLPGKVFFEYEPPRGPGRWNTLLALRVQKSYPQLIIQHHGHHPE